MRSRCLSLLALVCAGAAADERVLRVCADPHNMPLSSEQRAGFENKVAELIAAKLDSKVEYTWLSQRKSFIRDSLEAGRCDVLAGVPSALGEVATTQPYYRSSYVFVTRRDRNLHIASLLDEQLAALRIGVHAVGDDYAPPAFALARRGITQNVTAFSLFGSPAAANPARNIVDAVSKGDIDVAIVWGPLAGYYAKRSAVELDVHPVSPPSFAGVPFAYDISMAVRKGDEPLRSALDAALKAESGALQQLLTDYGIPQVP